MPRIRTIKPEFWSHPVMGRLSEAARLLALALLNLADDEGYFLADPALVRNFARPFDADSRSTTVALRELSGAGWIEVRESGTHGAIGRVVNFGRHQSINKPHKSNIRAYFDGAPVAVREDDGSATGGNGREWKGKELTTLSRAAEKPADATPRKVPTPEQQAARQAITSAIEAHATGRGVPFVWSAKDRTLVAQIATALGNDLARVRKVLDAAKADPWMAERFTPGPLRARLNELMQRDGKPPAPPPRPQQNDATTGSVLNPRTALPQASEILARLPPRQEPPPPETPEQRAELDRIFGARRHSHA